ncbi:MAG TPA: DUF2304 domain-containing protein [Candidatus Altiarchaeales archaeon]|nr:DUF2304 domain-containing protein [Candidatus Altiarchaeales archaeon]
MIDVTILQAGGLFVLLFLSYYTYVQYRKGVFNRWDVLLWSCVWIILMVMTFFPAAISPLVKSELFFRFLDVILVFSCGVMLVVCFYIYRRLRIWEDKTKGLIRAYAESSADFEKKD